MDLENEMTIGERLTWLERDVNTLKEKLRANEPPEAKFKVGQVLMLSVGYTGENAFCVRHTWYHAETKVWLYSNHRIKPNLYPNYWSPESTLRALTAAEKGDQDV
jgi:hypothetical protein